MYCKTTKKIVALIAMLALMMSVVTPALAVTGSQSVTTGLTSDTTGGNNPIVKVKWEMNAAKDTEGGKYLGTDDSISAGAQFLPSGVKDVSKRIAICAVVTDPDGLADINNVYADVYYPTGVALGSSHLPLPGQSGLGCGQRMQEDQMTRLTLTDGWNLICDRIQNHNENLPVWTQGYNYAEICAEQGELKKGTAAVYCAEKDLSYEDPAGNYKVLVAAADKVGKYGILENTFQYLDLTAFETDFTSVSYGNVRLNTHKIIPGDLAFLPNDGKPTVRNVGNTRLEMRVNQDDMGLGQTVTPNGTVWNVLYDGRVGSDAVEKSYVPNVWTTLNLPLDLSETNEMDFSIDISKFPPDHAGTDYTGNMTLSAAPVAHLQCR